MTTRLLLAAVALLPLAACGGASDDAAGSQGDAPAAASTAGATPAATPSADASATPAPGEPTATPTAGATPGATPSATPSPTATASARPSPTPSATRAAAPVAPPAAFATCNVCHSTTPGQNGVGPSLAGVIGRRAGTAAGYSYSPAMRSSNITWNDGTLERYLADPAAVVPGGSMPPPGADAAARRAIINYLKSL